MEANPGNREEINSDYNEFKEGKPCIVFCKRLMEMGGHGQTCLSMQKTSMRKEERIIRRFNDSSHSHL